MCKTSRKVKEEFDISEDESEDSVDEGLPLVIDTLMRPYMINQVMCARSAREADILDIMENSTTNVSMFDPRRRYLVSSSLAFRDMHGKKVLYAPNGDDGRAYGRR